MIAALEAGGELEVEQRRELADALDRMYVEFALEEEHHAIGREHSTLMRWRAFRVHCLVERGAYLRSAVLAVLRDGAAYKQIDALRTPTAR